MHCSGSARFCRQNGAAKAPLGPVKMPNAAAAGSQLHKRLTRADIFIARPAGILVDHYASSRCVATFGSWNLDQCSDETTT
jgi:hypothetical protein